MSASAAPLVGELRSRADRYPRHAVLACLVAGLLLGPRVPIAALAIALLVPLGLRRAGIGVLAALAVLGGALVAQARVRALEQTSLAPRLGHAVDARATMLEPPRRPPFGGRSVLVGFAGEPVVLRASQRVAWPANVGTGDVVHVRGSLRVASPYARLRRAHAELVADTVEPTGTRRGGPAGAVDAVRRRAERALDGDLPPPQAGLLRGMVLGQDAALPDDVREDFRAAGLSHLTAASGQNVVLLGALVIAVAMGLGIGFHARWVVVLALIALYVPLAGAGPSIQRAGVMGAAGVVAVLAGRPAARWYALGLAAGVTLVIDPRAAGDPGWQMSFVAVIALLGLARRWRDWLATRRVPAALAEALATTAAATVATAPLIAWHFDRVSLVSLPANVLAAPAVAPIMWLGLTAAAVGQLLPGVASALDAIAAFPLGYLTFLGHAAARAPGASVVAGPIAVTGGCAALGVFALAVATWRRPGPRAPRHARRRLVPVSAVAVAGLASVAVAGARRASPVPPPAGLRVTFLDVGQGDATLVQDRSAAILVDAGPPDGPIVQLLQRAGVKRLDLLAVTHAQADHEGGAAAVLRAVPVGAVLDGRDGVRSPDGARMAAEIGRRGVRRIVPDAGQVLRVGRLELRVLGPRREPGSLHAGEDPNQRAMVAEVRAERRRILLTADAESDVATALALGRVDVMKVAHHGSADPGLPDLLARVRPRIAVIEVGAHNTYGHPAPPTLRALAGVPGMYRTDQDGSVRLDLDQGVWRVRTHA